MDRRSWLWRRKSSEKSPGEIESSGGSFSPHSERFSDDQVQVNLNRNWQSHSEEATFVVPVPVPGQKDEGIQKLSEALLTINAKEELVKQHAKLAEEAVSGWEKAEREVLGLKQHIEALTVRNSTLEDRLVHLDGALKECLRQLRQTREERDQIAHEALEKKISDTESCLTSIDTELHHKLEMAEKENSDLRLQLSSMAEELEIRLIERELSNQAAEQASKQHLESVKKAAKFEAECRRLNSALKKANDHRSYVNMPSRVENGELKEAGRIGRNRMDSLVDIDLMDDFLQMERLAALPESYQVEKLLKKVESLDSVLKERENELKTSRNQLDELAERENELKVSRSRLEEAESKLAEHANELQASRTQFAESESKLAESENELKASRNRLEEAESKLAVLENELKESRNRLEEAEYKLAKHENELKASRNRLEEAQYKLGERENELQESRSQLEEAECKLAEHKNELKASQKQLKAAEYKLAEHENELKASRNRIEVAEYKMAEHENELKASKNRLEKAESKTESHLKMAEAGLEATHAKKEEAESLCRSLEAKLENLLRQVEYLEIDVQKEQNLSRKAEARYRKLTDEVLRLQHEAHGTKSTDGAEEPQFLRVKQEMELAMVGSKFAACQKTIASLSRQLQRLATLDDFLIDTVTECR